MRLKSVKSGAVSSTKNWFSFVFIFVEGDIISAYTSDDAIFWDSGLESLCGTPGETVTSGQVTFEGPLYM